MGTIFDSLFMQILTVCFTDYLLARAERDSRWTFKSNKKVRIFMTISLPLCATLANLNKSGQPAGLSQIES